MHELTIRWIQERTRRREYRITLHAEAERENDQISLIELEQALLSRIELIEDYPNDPRGQSSLLLGFTAAGKPLHLVCGSGNPEMLILITVYVPDENVWMDYRTRKD